ncbi:uncharacterized protein LOC120327809 [Styela clava]
MNLVQAQEAVEDLLECTICMNPYEASGPRTPKMLPCQHVFCLDCIKNIAERRRLVCPTCRAVHYKAIDDIPNSLILIQLLGRQGRCERKCEICHRQKDDPRSYCKKCIDEIVNRELAKAISLTQSYESDPTRRRVPAQKLTEAANPATNPQPQGNPELARQVPNGINLNRVAAFIDRYFFILMGVLFSIIIAFFIYFLLNNYHLPKNQNLNQEDHGIYPIDDKPITNPMIEYLELFLDEFSSLCVKLLSYLPSIHEIMYFICNFFYSMFSYIYNFSMNIYNDITTVYAPVIYDYFITIGSKVIARVAQFPSILANNFLSICSYLWENISDIVIAIAPRAYDAFINVLVACERVWDTVVKSGPDVVANFFHVLLLILDILYKFIIVFIRFVLSLGSVLFYACTMLWNVFS